MRESSDAITLIVTLDSGKLASERFAYDAVKSQWQLTTATSTTPLVAVASPQSSDQWVFTGTEGDRGKGRQVRILYTTLGPLAFRREHQIQVENTWVDDAETVCKRTSASIAAAASATSAPSRRPATPMPSRRPMTQAIFLRQGTPAPTRSPATPAPSRSPATPSPTRSASPPPVRDRAYHLIGGTWDCETIEGNSAPHTYTLARDGSMYLHTALSFGNKTFTIDERYHFDRARNVWTAATLGGSYTATAGPWLDDKWTFDGIAQINGHRVPERMIYTDLEEHAFRRDFRAVRGTQWGTIASETCKRRT